MWTSTRRQELPPNTFYSAGRRSTSASPQPGNPADGNPRRAAVDVDYAQQEHTQRQHFRNQCFDLLQQLTTLSETRPLAPISQPPKFVLLPPPRKLISAADDDSSLDDAGCGAGWDQREEREGREEKKPQLSAQAGLPNSWGGAHDTRGSSPGEPAAEDQSQVAVWGAAGSAWGISPETSGDLPSAADPLDASGFGGADDSSSGFAGSGFGFGPAAAPASPESSPRQVRAEPFSPDESMIARDGAEQLGIAADNGDASAFGGGAGVGHPSTTAAAIWESPGDDQPAEFGFGVDGGGAGFGGSGSVGWGANGSVDGWGSAEPDSPDSGSAGGFVGSPAAGDANPLVDSADEGKSPSNGRNWDDGPGEKAEEPSVSFAGWAGATEFPPDGSDYGAQGVAQAWGSSDFAGPQDRPTDSSPDGFGFSSAFASFGDASPSKSEPRRQPSHQSGSSPADAVASHPLAAQPGKGDGDGSSDGDAALSDGDADPSSRRSRMPSRSSGGGDGDASRGPSQDSVSAAAPRPAGLQFSSDDSGADDVSEATESDAEAEAEAALRGLAGFGCLGAPGVTSAESDAESEGGLHGFGGSVASDGFGFGEEALGGDGGGFGWSGPATGASFGNGFPGTPPRAAEASDDPDQPQPQQQQQQQQQQRAPEHIVPQSQPSSFEVEAPTVGWGDFGNDFGNAGPDHGFDFPAPGGIDDGVDLAAAFGGSLRASRQAEAVMATGPQFEEDAPRHAQAGPNPFAVGPGPDEFSPDNQAPVDFGIPEALGEDGNPFGGPASPSASFGFVLADDGPGADAAAEEGSGFGFHPSPVDANDQFQDLDPSAVGSPASAEEWRALVRGENEDEDEDQPSGPGDDSRAPVPPAEAPAQAQADGPLSAEPTAAALPNSPQPAAPAALKWKALGSDTGSAFDDAPGFADPRAGAPGFSGGFGEWTNAGAAPAPGVEGGFGAASPGFGANLGFGETPVATAIAIAGNGFGGASGGAGLSFGDLANDDDGGWAEKAGQQQQQSPPPQTSSDGGLGWGNVDHGSGGGWGGDGPDGGGWGNGMADNDGGWGDL